MRPVQKYLPLGFALTINAILVISLTLTSFTVPVDRDDYMNVTLDNFLLDQPDAKPRSGDEFANLAAIQQQAEHMMLTPDAMADRFPPNEISAPVPVVLQLKTSGPMVVSVDAMAEIQSRSIRPIEGAPETERAVGETGWDRTSKSAKGNMGAGWNRPGKDSLKGQEIVLIIDVTLCRPNEADLTAEVKSLIDTLRRTNTVLGEITCCNGVLVSKSGKHYDKLLGCFLDGEGKPQSDFSPAKNVRSVWNGSNSLPADRISAYWAVKDACLQFAGRKAAIILISDFAEGANNLSEVEPLVKALIHSELRLYLITIDEVPSAVACMVARQSGGDIRRVYNSYWKEMNRAPDEIPWADPQSRNLLRNLDSAPAVP